MMSKFPPPVGFINRRIRSRRIFHHPASQCQNRCRNRWQRMWALANIHAIEIGYASGEKRMCARSVGMNASITGGLGKE